MTGCKPSSSVFESQTHGDPGPPDAPVVAALTEYGASSDPRSPSDAPVPLAVSEYGPEGPLRSSRQLFVRFNQPMDTRRTDGITVELSPEVAVTSTWVDPFRLLIEPNSELGSARTYAITVRGEASSAIGEALSLDLRWTVETLRPQATVDVIRDYWGREREHWKTAFRVHVSQEVRARDLRRALRATAVPLDDPDATPTPVRTRLRRSDRRYASGWEVLPRTHWPPNSRIVLELGPDLVGKAGPLPTARTARAELETSPGLTARLHCHENFEDGCGPTWLSVRFDHPLPVSAARKIRVSPRPKNFEIDTWTGYGDEVTEVHLMGDFEIGQHYRIRTTGKIRDAYGQPLVAPFDRTVDIVPPPPGVELVPEHGVIPRKSDRPPTLGVEARSLRTATLASVQLDDAGLARVLSTEREHWRLPKGAEVQRQKLDPLPHEGPFEWTSVAVDLRPALGGEYGAALVQAVPGEATAAGRDRPGPKGDIALVQVTNLGAVVGLSASRSMIRVSSLDTGSPVAGARVTLHPPKSHRRRHDVRRYGPSDDEGIIWLPSADEIPEHTVAIVRKGDDRFGLDLGTEGRDVGKATVVGATVTERRLYQPGDRVRLMGWAAQSTPKTESGLRALDKGIARLELRDPKGRVIGRKSLTIKSSGKFWSTFRLPADGALGSYRFVTSIGGQEFQAAFRVREFRTPTYEVEASVDRGDVTRGEAVRVDLNANYLYGKQTPLLVARSGHRCHSTAFIPPDHLDYTTAVPTPNTKYFDHPTQPLDLDSDDAKRGHVDFTLPTEGLAAGFAHRCVIDIAVQDPAFEEMGDSVSFLAHPPHYLVLGPPPQGLAPGKTGEVQVEALDRDGVAVDGGSVSVKVEKVKWVDRKRVRTAVKTCRLEVGSAGTATCRFRPRKPGSYEVTLEGTVDGADVAATRSFHVYEPYRPRAAASAGPPEPPRHPRLQLDVPDEINAGDMVRVAVDGRQPEAFGFVVGSHAGIRWLRSLTLADHEAEFEVPASDAWIPSMNVRAFVTPGETRKSLPTMESTGRRIRVPAHTRRLGVDVSVPEQSKPGSRVSIGVSVEGADGQPVNSHVTVWAVDEAVLALQPLALPDLVQKFAVERGAETWFTDAFGLMTWPYRTRPDPYSGLGIGTGYGSGSGAGFGGRGKRTPRVRQAKAVVRREFDAAPIFLGDVATGPDGRAVVHGKLPDNLTTFRVLAVASAGLPGGGPVGRFGRGEARLRVTSELTLQPLLPRVLRPGDRARLAGLVANLSGAGGDAEVSIELHDAAGILELTGPSSRRRTLDNGSQAIVPFEVRARGVGQVEIRLLARLHRDDGSVREDAVELPLTVQVERTQIHRSAAYGSLETEAAAIELRPPGEVARGSGSVEVSLYGSLLSGYLDTAEDLVEYPYGCVEQTSSRMVPLIALRSMDATEALGIDDLSEFVGVGVSRLESMQTDSGGFGYWPGASQPHVYASAYATWVLTLADSAGLDVPDGMLEQARRFLRQEIEQFDREASNIYDDVRVAMAVQAIAESGHPPAKAVDGLWERRERLPVFARAMLLMSLGDDAERKATLVDELLREVDEQEAYARTRAPRLRYGRVFDSPIRTDAMVLLALTRTVPDHPIIEKLARGLSRSRDAGQLRNTQENAYALLAMAAYAKEREAIAPDLRAAAWVGPQRIVQGRLIGRRAAELGGEGSLPRAAAAAGRVTISREGEGRLYYRVGMTWAPTKAPTEPHASGLVLKRTLRTETSTVEAGTPVDGGELVALDVEISTGVRRGYVAIELPLPAGLEAVDTTIGRGRSAMVLDGDHGRWVSHQELRADRVLLFADDLAPGRHRHTVFLRATTPGTYQLPPARAESMYYPEVFGTTAGDRITVR